MSRLYDAINAVRKTGRSSMKQHNLSDRISMALAQRAIDMPDDKTALIAMMQAYRRLKDLGWREAMYCPKDGSWFHVIEAGSSGIHDCHYSGKWPTGIYWVSGGGDLWPAHPILFRAIETKGENNAN